MSAKYDAELCARLATEAREEDGRLPSAPWSNTFSHSRADVLAKLESGEVIVVARANITDDDATDREHAIAYGIARARNNLRAMADQLDAARADVDRLRASNARLAKQSRELDTVLVENADTERARADAAEAECDAALANIATLRSQVADQLQTIETGNEALRAVRAQWDRERDELRRTVETLQGQLEAAAPVVDLVKAFVETVNAATRHFANRGKGGQHVSFHGDFAGANPSTMSRLEWWARAFASKLGTSNE